MAQREAAARRKGQRSAVRDGLIINLALFTGLRVQEIADLKCGDIMIKEDTAFIIVQCGKGDKSRLVHFNGELSRHLKAYLEWKVTQGEGIQPADPLLFSRYGDGPLSKRALQRAFARMSKAAGINNHCFHHLRHTYASHLYKASGYNLRLVQKQLGHASIRTTQIYADVFDEDLNRALEKLYK
jgi:integrase